MATSDTDRTEASETLSVDAMTISYIMTDANMDGLGDVNMGAVLINENVGKSTDVWATDVSIGSIPTVLVSNIPTRVANFTADRSRYNIAYTEDSGTGTWTQVQEDFVTRDVPTGASSALSLDLPVDPAVADDLPAGQSLVFTFVVGGVTLKVNCVESG